MQVEECRAWSSPAGPVRQLHHRAVVDGVWVVESCTLCAAEHMLLKLMQAPLDTAVFMRYSLYRCMEQPQLGPVL